MTKLAEESFLTRQFFFSMGRYKIIFDSVLHNILFRKSTERNSLALVVDGQKELIGLFQL